jgi:hypothetical protein
MNNKKYDITYRLPKGNDIQQHMVIEAPSAHMAKKIFEAEFPQLRLVTTPVQVRR